jgi:hypothetical protein
MCRVAVIVPRRGLLNPAPQKCYRKSALSFDTVQKCIPSTIRLALARLGDWYRLFVCDGQPRLKPAPSLGRVASRKKPA